MGYEFLCITDHSQSTVIANGQSPDRLARQIEQIHKINAKLKGITLLAGAEVDILAEGRLDFDDKLLADLDYVVASIHSALGGARERVTTRTLKAMDNPYVTCIGHPTGRLIGHREAMDLDMPAVIEHAAQTGTALEVNSDPSRLDLKDVHCRMAVEAGVKLAIGTDAHSAGSLALMLLRRRHRRPRLGHQGRRPQHPLRRQTQVLDQVKTGASKKAKGTSSASTLRSLL